MRAVYVERSHKRCMEMGVPLDRVYSARIITGKELQKKLRNAGVDPDASPFMISLYNLLRGQGFLPADMTKAAACSYDRR